MAIIKTCTTADLWEVLDGPHWLGGLVHADVDAQGGGSSLKLNIPCPRAILHRGAGSQWGDIHHRPWLESIIQCSTVLVIKLAIYV